MRMSSDVRCAIGARTVKHQLVPAYVEVAAGKAIDTGQAPAQFKYPGALITEEVVMVRLPRTLVYRDRSGELDGGQPALLQQVSDVSVNRRDSQALCVLLRCLENLARRKRTVGALESCSNSRPLPGLPLICHAPSKLNNSTLSIL